MSACICGRRHSHRALLLLQNYLISNKEESCEAPHLSGKPRIKPCLLASSSLGKKEDTDFKFSSQIHLFYCTSLLIVTYSIGFIGDSEVLLFSLGRNKLHL